jgi:two-component system, NtrC family, sensor kinase
MSTETVNLEIIALRQRVKDLERRFEADVINDSTSSLTKLLRNIPGLVYEFCLDPDGRIYFNYISEKCSEVLGFESQKNTYDSPILMNIIYQADRKSFINSVADSGKNLKPWAWEGRIVTPAQEIKWLQGFSHPEQQKNGTITWQGIFLDITENKQVEKQLKRINSIFNAQFETGIDGILILDEKGKIQSYNRRFCEMWEVPITVDNSFSDEEVFQQVFSQLIHPEEFSLTLDFLSEQRTAFLYNDIYLKNNRVFERYSSPIVSGGDEYFGRIWYFRDISDRKRSETALKQSEIQLRQQKLELEETLKELQRTQSQLIQNEKMSSLGQLVAGVAHEINNPVNFIYGNLDHAQQNTEDLVKILNLYQTQYPEPTTQIQEEAENIDLDFLLTDLPKIYNSMRVGASRIREIVTSLRTFSRLDEAELKNTNIHEGIDSTLMILEHRLKGKPESIAIKIVKEYGDLPLIECYAGQLNQVFMNILANAIDALETGIEKKLTTEPSIHIISEVINHQQMQIRIIDNGTGVTQEVKQRLFDPFYTTKPVGKGTGMGLSISYQIITERHKGSLECKSVLGEGTEFLVILPINQVEEYTK